MDYAAMGERIRSLRRQRDLTQACLAEMVEVSTSFIGHIERGTRVLSLETFVRLCQALKADPGLLLGITADNGELHPKEQLLKMLERSTEIARQL